MKRFNFERAGQPLKVLNIVKFMIGWHSLSYCFYKFYWKPKVQQNAEKDGYEWDQLTSGERYTFFMGNNLKETERKSAVLFRSDSPSSEAYCKESTSSEKTPPQIKKDPNSSNLLSNNITEGGKSMSQHKHERGNTINESPKS